MKIRIASAAFLIASLAGFALNGSAAALTCSNVDGEGDREVSQCSSSYIVDAAVPAGYFLWVSPVSADTSLPNPPMSSVLGDVFSISIKDASGNLLSKPAQIELCLKDPSSSGNVYMWGGSAPLYDVIQTGSWWYLPTYHQPGWDCATTTSQGVFGSN
jgi:hypothetical protein